MSNFDEMGEVNTDFSALEELASSALLIEMVNAKKAEIFENVVFDGERRYYIQDLTERSYSLENCTPYQIEVDDIVIEEHAWGILLCKMTRELLKKYPQKETDIFSFRTDWSKQEIQSAPKQLLICNPVSSLILTSNSITENHS